MRRLVPGLLFALFLLAIALPPAHAFELFTWWRRDLLELKLEPGDWARYALTDVSEEGAFADTLVVTVMAGGDETERWLRIEGNAEQPIDFLLVEPARLRGGGQPLDAVLRLLRRDRQGRWEEEDLTGHRESRLVQRHLEDPFDQPMLERRALADTLVQGRSLTRERILLSEVRQEARKIGSNALVIETDLRSVAELSPELPFVGLLQARTVTMVSTRTESPEGKALGRAAPPLFSERTLRCIGFGRLDPPPMDAIPTSEPH